ncbi:MAG: sigma-70 family RNA polymerase sigma factor [Candidatus Omnitrophota bacterium]
MDELEFIQRCVDGDKASWDAFVEKYSRLIYNYIRNVLIAKKHAFVPSDIDDIFQGIFYSLARDNYKKLKSFKGKNGASLATWLRLVTVNFTIDFTRKSKAAVSLEAGCGEGFSLEDILADDSASVVDKLSREERLDTLKECISRLASDDRFFLELYLNRGISLQALTGILKLTRGAVDMQKRRIVGWLRDCFRSKGFALDS